MCCLLLVRKRRRLLAVRYLRYGSALQLCGTQLYSWWGLVLPLVCGEDSTCKQRGTPFIFFWSYKVFSMHQNSWIVSRVQGFSQNSRRTENVMITWSSMQSPFLRIEARRWKRLGLDLIILMGQKKIAVYAYPRCEILVQVFQLEYWWSRFRVES